MMIDINKKYRTRDGREVRIYATDGDGAYSVHGAIKEDGGWTQESWTDAGCYTTSGERRSDLIEVKEKIVKWVNVYPKHMSGTYNSKEEASKESMAFRIACIRIEFEEGEGL